MLSASTTKPATLANPEATRWLAFGAVGGPVLFTLAWLVLGFLSPGMIFAGSPLIPSSPITAPISGLGLGPTGPFMNAGFVLGGLLLMGGCAWRLPDQRHGERPACGTLGVRSALLALSGVGLVVAGFFTLESFFRHFVGFLLGTGTPVLSFLTTGSFFAASRADGGSATGSSSAVR